MIPKKFVTYINFPKNKNEKVDREKIKKIINFIYNYILFGLS